jgi:hypothetical protein
VFCERALIESPFGEVSSSFLSFFGRTEEHKNTGKNIRKLLLKPSAVKPLCVSLRAFDVADNQHFLKIVKHLFNFFSEGLNQPEHLSENTAVSGKVAHTITRDFSFKHIQRIFRSDFVSYVCATT